MTQNKRRKIQDYLKPNMITKGRIINIEDYGAFIELPNHIVGLLPIENISISRIRSPYERFQIGQTIPVKVKQINQKKNQVTFTYKELLGTWEENVKKVKEGMKLEGIIKEKEKNQNGIFVELTPNLVGLAEYKENMQYGERVQVYIKKIIPEKKKIKLIIL